MSFFQRKAIVIHLWLVSPQTGRNQEIDRFWIVSGLAVIHFAITIGVISDFPRQKGAGMVMRELRVPLSLLSLMVFMGFSLPARGSALPPLIRASQSANGKFLVVTELEFENPQQQGPHVIKKSIYRVLRVESFINAKDRLDSRSVFWTDTPWTITREGGEAFYPLISNDGRYLVLVRLAPPFPDSPPVLELYHQEFSAGVLKTVLVRQIPITDLWTAREINPEGAGFFIQTGATPQWFSGGSLNFSADDQNLIYRTQWNDVLMIRLADGSITPQVR